MARKETSNNKLPQGKRHLLRKRNKMLLVIAIQSLYQVYKIHEGVRDTWIYEQHIYPVYFIGKSTFKQYLQLNAKKKLREIDLEIKNLEQSCNGPSE